LPCCSGCSAACQTGKNSQQAVILWHHCSCTSRSGLREIYMVRPNHKAKLNRETLSDGDIDHMTKRLGLNGDAAGGQPSEGSAPAPQSTFCRQQASASSDAGPSLMEQMMAESQAAADESKAETRRLKKEFGGGFAKGFLGGSRSSKKKGKKAAQEATTSVSKAPRKAAGGVLDGEPKNQSAGLGDMRSVKAKQDGLVLLDVQEALKGRQKLEDGAWMTPDLMEKISSRPELVAALQSPNFTKALELMKSDPAKAKALLQKNPQATELLAELASILGGHFQELGAAEDMQLSQEKVEAAANAAGPLAEEAVKRQLSEAPLPEPTSQEQQAVEEVIGNPELRALLMDPEMQHVLQECGQPGRLGYYMS
ncbi:unnamed protein product, partial [Chrysoparadoxa australica]